MRYIVHFQRKSSNTTSFLGFQFSYFSIVLILYGQFFIETLRVHTCMLFLLADPVGAPCISLSIDNVLSFCYFILVRFAMDVRNLIILIYNYRIVYKIQ